MQTAPARARSGPDPRHFFLQLPLLYGFFPLTGSYPGQHRPADFFPDRELLRDDVDRLFVGMIDRPCNPRAIIASR